MKRVCVMAGASNIEWTDATWNPIVGCSIKSPGCINCYAQRTAWRLGHNPATPHYAGTAEMSKAGPVFTGKVAQAPDSILTEPLRWKKPRKIFVNSMGDLFHESIPDEWIDRVFAVMALCPQHTFQVLTKRADRMLEYLSAGIYVRLFKRVDLVGELFKANGLVVDHRQMLMDGRLPNVWLGVSTERQQEADERIPLLLQTPAAVRFISAEPLIGPLDISNYLVETARTNWDWYLDWVIVGGESGPGARPMHPAWAQSLRDQCVESDVPFFFKQWGEWEPRRSINVSKSHALCGLMAAEPHIERDWVKALDFLKKSRDIDGTAVLERTGKKNAGRELDSKLHNAFPEAKEVAFA